jgi:NAD(P)-dependent dehydrogenase (short-subunit alcohol dehydrogenase family)
LASELGAKAGEAQFVTCDVSDVEAIRELIDSTVARYGRLDCLVNNAGWHPPHKPIDDFSWKNFATCSN